MPMPKGDRFILVLPSNHPYWKLPPAEQRKLIWPDVALRLVAQDLEHLAVAVEPGRQEFVVDAARRLVAPAPLQDEERVLVAHDVVAPVVRRQRDGVGAGRREVAGGGAVEDRGLGAQLIRGRQATVASRVASRTRSRCASLTVAEVRAAVSSAAPRGSSEART